MNFLSMLPNLEKLYIADNSLTNLDGLDMCPSLEIIHARKN